MSSLTTPLSNENRQAMYRRLSKAAEGLITKPLDDN